jgi:hypothetical protein
VAPDHWRRRVDDFFWIAPLALSAAICAFAVLFAAGEIG